MLRLVLPTKLLPATGRGAAGEELKNLLLGWSSDSAVIVARVVDESAAGRVQELQHEHNLTSRWGIEGFDGPRVVGDVHRGEGADAGPRRQEASGPMVVHLSATGRRNGLLVEVEGKGVTGIGDVQVVWYDDTLPFVSATASQAGCDVSSRPTTEGTTFVDTVVRAAVLAEAMEESSWTSMEPALAGHLLAWYRDAFRQAYRLTSAVVALPFQLALAALLLAVTDIDAVRDLANVLRECAEVGLEALSLQRVLPLRYLVAGFTHATTGVLAAASFLRAHLCSSSPVQALSQLAADATATAFMSGLMPTSLVLALAGHGVADPSPLALLARPGRLLVTSVLDALHSMYGPALTELLSWLRETPGGLKLHIETALGLAWTMRNLANVTVMRMLDVLPDGLAHCVMHAILLACSALAASGRARAVLRVWVLSWGALLAPWLVCQWLLGTALRILWWIASTAFVLLRGQAPQSLRRLRVFVRSNVLPRFLAADPNDPSNLESLIIGTLVFYPAVFVAPAFLVFNATAWAVTSPFHLARWAVRRNPLATLHHAASATLVTLLFPRVLPRTLHLDLAQASPQGSAPAVYWQPGPGTDPRPCAALRLCGRAVGAFEVARLARRDTADFKEQSSA